MIALSVFKGEIPKIDAHLLPEENAAEAINCLLDHGNLQPLNGPTIEESLEDGVKTIYRFGDRWLQWANAIHVVESLAYSDANRILYTGDDYPKETNSTLALTSSPYPTASRRLGIAAPTTALTTSITTTGTGTDRDISYCYTRVGIWEDDTVVESAPSPATDIETIKDDAEVNLTGFTDDSSDGAYTTHYRIYRINHGDTGAEFQYVADIAKTTSPLEYDDDHSTNTDDDLGEVLPTENWTAPESDLKGIITASNGLIFGFTSNKVFVSESYIQYAYPSIYSLTVTSEIVGLGFTGNAIAVLTKTIPYLIYGADPGSLSIDRLPLDAPCKSARSIVNVPEGTIYSSVMGLVLIDSTGAATVITKDLYTAKQWIVLEPETLLAVYYNDTYLAFWEGTPNGIEVRVGRNEIRQIQLDKNVHGGQYVSTVSLNLYDFLTSTGDNYVSSEGYQLVCTGDEYSIPYDTLYLIQGDELDREVVSWRTGSLTDYTWKSKEFKFMSDKVITAGILRGDYTDGSVILTLYVDGNIVFKTTVTSEDVFRIPPVRGRTFQIKLVGDAIIDHVALGQSVSEVIA